MELYTEGNVVGKEPPFGAELCLKESPFFVYGGRKPPDPKVKELGSKKRNLLSSMMLVKKRKGRPRRAVKKAVKTG